jgi:hypothetical protein
MCKILDEVHICMIIPVFIFVILLIVLVLFIKMQVTIRIYKEGEKKEFKIELFIIKKIRIYEYDYKNLEIQERNTGIEKVRLAYEKISDVFGAFKYANRRTTRIFGEIKIKYLKIHITSGTGDICITGILNGLLWSLAGVLDSMISNNFKVYEKNISVKSNFNEKTIIIDADCIIVFRIAHIMEVGVKIFFLGLKRKTKEKKDKAVV